LLAGSKHNQIIIVCSQKAKFLSVIIGKLLIYLPNTCIP